MPAPPVATWPVGTANEPLVASLVRPFVIDPVAIASHAFDKRCCRARDGDWHEGGGRSVGTSQTQHCAEQGGFQSHCDPPLGEP